MSIPNWIDDGYTLHCKLADGYFFYRPMLARERNRVISLARLAAEEQVVEAIISHVICWSWSVPLRVESVRSLGDVSHGITSIVMGVCWPGAECEWFAEDEHADVANLRAGLRLEQQYPWLMSRDCSACERYVYDTESNLEYRRGGELMERLPSHPAPCRTSKSCPKGTPERSNVLTQRNAMAVRHYWECAATCLFPDDPIVKRNARVIAAELRSLAGKRRQSEIVKGLSHRGQIV